MHDYIRLSAVLFAITASVALVLAIGNAATAERIELLTLRASTEAQMQVLKQASGVDPQSAQTIPYEGESSAVSGITQFKDEAGDIFYAVSCTPKGYGGEISMMVGIDSNLTITGISIIDSSSETPGLGANINNKVFYGQFEGKGGGIAISKSSPGENEVQAVTGATISSKAVVKGAGDAIAAVREVQSK